MNVKIIFKDERPPMICRVVERLQEVWIVKTDKGHYIISKDLFYEDKVEKID